MKRSRFKLLLCFLVLFLSLSFCFSSSAINESEDPEIDAGESYFTETDDFRVFTRNQIYLYEPCETLNSGSGEDDDPTPIQGDYILYTGTEQSVKEIIYNAAYTIANHTWAHAAGIVDAIKYLDGDDLDAFNPLTNNGYLNWDSSEFSELKEFIKKDSRLDITVDDSKLNEDLDNILSGDTSVSNWKEKLIAAEFTFYFSKHKSKITDGYLISPESDGFGDSTEKDAIYAGNAFLDPNYSSKPAEKIKKSPFFNDVQNGKIEYQESGIMIRLTGFSKSSDYKTRTLLIGDSLANRAQNHATSLPIEDNNINALEGRPFEDGINLISSKGNDFKYLVYALGNNNCENGCKSSQVISEAILQEVVDEAKNTFGEEVYVFFLTSFRPVGDKNTYSYETFTELPSNETIRSFAESNEKVRVIDWADYLKNRLAQDELPLYVDETGHINSPKGADLFWELVENALSAAEEDYNWDRDQAPCLDRSDRREEVEVGSEDECEDFFNCPTPSDGDSESGGGDGSSGTGGESGSTGGSGGSSGGQSGGGSSGDSGGSGGSSGGASSSSGLRDISIGQYYNQNDSKWKNIQWKGGNCPNCTIGKSGCPMVSVINALYAVGYDVNPKSGANLMSSATNNFSKRLPGLFSSDGDWSNVPEKIVPWYAKKAGASIQEISSSEINTKLSQGYAIVIHGKRNQSVTTECYGKKNGECIFTKGGHVIAIVGAKNGKWLVANPGNGGNRAISPSDVINKSYMSVKHIWAIKKN